MSNSIWQNLLPTSCDWCPVCCGANRSVGNAGLCGADDKCIVARSSIHYWEEPPISGLVGGKKRGFGPGSGTIFFANCSIGCIYCQNRKISGVQNKADNIDDKPNIFKSVNIDELTNMMLKLQSSGVMNINFVTGTHYRSHVISAVRHARSKGLEIPTVWNTSGYETIASISALSSCVDVWLPDFKYSDSELAAQMSRKTKLENYPEIGMESIAQMLDFCPEAQFEIYNENLRMTKGIIVRHMILPGHIDNSKRALKMLFSEFGNNIKYSIMNQYTPVIQPGSKAAIDYPELLNPVSESDYEDVLNYADLLGIEDYYWQQGGTASASFIPDF